MFTAGVVILTGNNYEQMLVGKSKTGKLDIFAGGRGACMHGSLEPPALTAARELYEETAGAISVDVTTLQISRVMIVPVSLDKSDHGSTCVFVLYVPDISNIFRTFEHNYKQFEMRRSLHFCENVSLQLIKKGEVFLNMTDRLIYLAQNL